MNAIANTILVPICRSINICMQIKYKNIFRNFTNSESCKKNLWEEPKYTGKKNLEPVLSVLQGHGFGIDFLLNPGRLVH